MKDAKYFYYILSRLTPNNTYNFENYSKIIECTCSFTYLLFQIPPNILLNIAAPLTKTCDNP